MNLYWMPRPHLSVQMVSHKAILFAAAKQQWLGEWHVVIVWSVYAAGVVVLQSQTAWSGNVCECVKTESLAKWKDSAHVA